MILWTSQWRYRSFHIVPTSTRGNRGWRSVGGVTEESFQEKMRTDCEMAVGECYVSFSDSIVHNVAVLYVMISYVVKSGAADR